MRHLLTSASVAYIHVSWDLWCRTRPPAAAYGPVVRTPTSRLEAAGDAACNRGFVVQGSNLLLPHASPINLQRYNQMQCRSRAAAIFTCRQENAHAVNFRSIDEASTLAIRWLAAMKGFLPLCFLFLHDMLLQTAASCFGSFFIRRRASFLFRARGWWSCDPCPDRLYVAF